MSYARTVAASLAETGSKFAVADALLADIPHTPGERDGNVQAALEAAVTEIVSAGGEARTWRTLGEYRKLALWKGEGTWLPGYSFTAHMQAMRSATPYSRWSANPATSRLQVASEDRVEAAPPTVEEVTNVWTPAQTEDFLAQAVAQNPRLIRDVLANASREALADATTGLDVTGAQIETQERRAASRSAALPAADVNPVQRPRPSFAPAPEATPLSAPIPRSEFTHVVGETERMAGQLSGSLSSNASLLLDRVGRISDRATLLKIQADLASARDRIDMAALVVQEALTEETVTA